MAPQTRKAQISKSKDNIKNNSSQVLQKNQKINKKIQDKQINKEEVKKQSVNLKQNDNEQTSQIVSNTKSISKNQTLNKQPTNQNLDQKSLSIKKQKTERKTEQKLIVQTVKGSYAVDSNCPAKQFTHIYVSGSKAYDATLNQSNINQNNNKFYIIQLLQHDQNQNQFYVWNRWGRVGVVGQSALKGPMGLEQAQNDYEKKLNDKTIKGDYRVIEISMENEDEDSQKSNKENQSKPKKESTLPKSTQKLISLIFDLKMMNQQMKEIGYDAKKMPLGKLAKSSIEKGYKILADIANELKSQKRKQILEQLSSDFYSNIPHDFGYQQQFQNKRKMSLFLINSEKMVKEKLDMLQSISDIQIATKLLQGTKEDSDINALDQEYKKLNCEIKPARKEVLDMIKKYVQNTHGHSHNNYSLEVEDVWEVNRSFEAQHFNPNNLENRMLLWHGSRLTNWVGILSQGLRIAPPEAPATGYMFGKGVYFADMVSKSANYCCTNSTSNTGIMLLCEVALGKCQERLNADYNANVLQQGCSSTKGCGKFVPDENQNLIFEDTIVPMGKEKSQSNLNILIQNYNKNSSLLYNEYIVYNIHQVKMKYLLRMKFNYKKNY